MLLGSLAPRPRHTLNGGRRHAPSLRFALQLDMVSLDAVK
jgi:hypothetical protein